MVRELHRLGEGGADLRGDQRQTSEFRQSRHCPRIPVREYLTFVESFKASTRTLTLHARHLHYGFIFLFISFIAR